MIELISSARNFVATVTPFFKLLKVIF